MILVHNKMLKFICIGVCLFIIDTSLLHAQIYQWTDSEGTVHFSDKPVNDRAKSITPKSNINNYSPVPRSEFKYTPAKKSTKSNLVKPKARAGQVIMYSTQWCGYCKKAKAYFNAKGIGFSERDIEKSTRAREEHLALGGGGVPVIVIGKRKGQQIMRGFSAERFETLRKQ